MADYEVTCAECGVETTVPFQPDGSRPVTCRDCFQKKRGGGQGRDRGDRQMFDAVCGECGVETQVPFKPTGPRPVLCSDCFRPGGDSRDGGGGRGGGGRGGRGGHDDGWQKEFDVTCAECGVETTVPFRPVAGKPVLCRKCFTGGKDDEWQDEFEVTCAECGIETTVPFKPTSGRPVKCKECFSKSRPPRGGGGGYGGGGGGFGGRDGGRGGDRGGDRPSFDATCAECGIKTTVPFKPTGARPVYCRDCFRR